MLATPSAQNNFCIIPKVAYVEIETTSSIENFLLWWDLHHSGVPTQKDYDEFVKSALKNSLQSGMDWSSRRIKIRQDN